MRSVSLPFTSAVSGLHSTSVVVPDVLLPSEQFSPKQFEKLFLVISSDQVGLFTLELIHPGGPIPELGSCEIRMEDLLQAKFENKSTLDMFDQVARVRVNTLIFLINKSELVCLNDGQLMA